MATAFQAQPDSIETLNEFLRAEITASEAYRVAIEKLEKSTTSRTELEAARASHIQRVRKLQARIRELGGVPAQTGSAWGGLSKTISSTASLMGERSAVAVLEEGEDVVLRRYRDELSKLEGVSHEFLVNDLLPRQFESHKLLSELKRHLAV